MVDTFEPNGKGPDASVEPDSQSDFAYPIKRLTEMEFAYSTNLIQSSNFFRQLRIDRVVAPTRKLGRLAFCRPDFQDARREFQRPDAKIW